MNTHPYTLEQLLAFINTDGKDIDDETRKAAVNALHDALFGLVDLDKTFFETLPSGVIKKRIPREPGQRGAKHDMSLVTTSDPAFVVALQYVNDEIDYEDALGEIEEIFDVKRSTANTYLKKLKPRAIKTANAIKYMQQLVK